MAEKTRTVRELFDLTGRVAVVTGGTGLFGRQIAEALAEAGARTFMASRNIEKLQAQAEVFRQAGLDVTALQYDQASEPSVLQLLQQALAAAGKVDILKSEPNQEQPRSRRNGRPCPHKQPRPWTTTRRSANNCTVWQSR